MPPHVPRSASAQDIRDDRSSDGSDNQEVRRTQSFEGAPRLSDFPMPPRNSVVPPLTQSNLVGRTAKAHFLRRFLIDMLVFTYGVNELQVHNALSADKSPLLDNLRRSYGGRFSLLTQVEQQQALDLGQVIQWADSLVAQNQHSILTYERRALIVSCAVDPAALLDVHPGYVLEQFRSYATHQCDPDNRRKTLLYAHTSSGFNFLGREVLAGKWRSNKQQELLAQRLVTDDVVMANDNVVQSEELRTVVGMAIAEFNKNNCKVGMGSVARDFYIQSSIARLLDELAQWKFRHGWPTSPGQGMTGTAGVRPPLGFIHEER